MLAVNKTINIFQCEFQSQPIMKGVNIPYTLNNYKFSFNKDIPLFNQINNDITKNLITYIYVNYINKDNNQYFENEINNILNEVNN